MRSVLAVVLVLASATSLVGLADTDSNEYGTASACWAGESLVVSFTLAPAYQSPAEPPWFVYMFSSQGWQTSQGVSSGGVAGIPFEEIEFGGAFVFSDFGVTGVLALGVGCTDIIPTDFLNPLPVAVADTIRIEVANQFGGIAFFTLTVDAYSAGPNRSAFAIMLLQQARTAMGTYTVVCTPHLEDEDLIETLVTYTSSGDPVEDVPVPSYLQLWKVAGETYYILTTPWDFLPLSQALVDGVPVPGLYETPIDVQALLDDPAGGPGTYIVSAAIGGFAVPTLGPDDEPVLITIP